MKENQLFKKEMKKQHAQHSLDVEIEGMVVGKDVEDVVNRVLNHDIYENDQPDREVLEQIDLDEVEKYLYTLKKEKKRRMISIIGGGIFLVIALSIIVTFGFFKSHVKVQDYVGMEAGNAVQSLYDQGFSAKIEREYSKYVKKGEVIAQSVAPETRVRVSDTIILTVSDGRAPIKIRNVVGRKMRIAEKMLKKQEMKVIMEKEYSDTVDVRRVIKMIPKAGTELVPGEGEVTIVVSLGIEKVKVESVLGMTQDEAEDLLNKAGFRVKVGKAYATTTEKGRVCLMDPVVEHDKDVMLTKGSEVTIYISQGVDPKTVKSKKSNETEEVVTIIK